MPYRNSTLWLVVLGLAGVMLLAGLAVFGVDIFKGARTGPRWKRKLLAAGLILLGLGTGGASGGERHELAVDCYYIMELPIPTDTLPASATVEQQKMWRQVTETWRQARDITSRERLTYPQTKKEQVALLASLKTAQANVETLRKGKILNDAGGKLLIDEFKQMTVTVQQFRPDPGVGRAMATCYRPMPRQPIGRVSLTRLSGRMVELEKLVAAGTLKDGPAYQVAAMIRRDAKILREPIYQARLNEKEQAAAKKLVVRADALLKTLPKPPANAPRFSPLNDSVEWHRVQAVRALAMNYAKNGSTTQQRKEFDKKYAEAEKAIATLSHTGLISGSVAGLLKGDLTQAKKDVCANPPTDSKESCYDVGPIYRARESLKRLSQQVSLLESMVAQDRLRPAAVRVILVNVEKDLKTLTDPKERELLSADEQKQAKLLVPKIEKSIKTLQGFVKRNATP